MSKKELVVLIEFIDRFGLGYEVFEALKNHRINILGMEATANKGMMLKFEDISKVEIEALLQDLYKITGVTSIVFKEQMPYEQRENQLKTILNLSSEGILAVNKSGEITHINEVAARVIHTTVEKAVGNKIQNILLSNIPILDTLSTGKGYELKEIKMKINGNTFHYLTSGSPILGESGQIIGAVATIKDYRQVEEIISKVKNRNKLTTFTDIIFQSNKMKRIIDTAKTVAKSDSSVMLRGESGTGKELFARAIHMESNRMNKPFIAINCAALPESLLESELFGYEEGTFTGAVKGGKKGLFEQANEGTLFLDEIGEISQQIQVRLLRVLQENFIRRVGGSREIPINVRIITATHRNLEELIDKGQFREDLYYRLNVIPITIPPLRERPEDIPLITQHLIRKISKKLNKENVYLSLETISYLQNQPWPGNVRQLENTLERVLNLIGQEEITLQSFQYWAGIQGYGVKSQMPENEAIVIPVPLDSNWPPLKEIVAKVEKQVLLKVLKKHKSSRKAGNILGVSNTTILNKMKSFGIKPQNSETEFYLEDI